MQGCLVRVIEVTGQKTFRTVDQGHTTLAASPSGAGLSNAAIAQVQAYTARERGDDHAREKAALLRGFALEQGLRLLP